MTVAPAADTVFWYHVPKRNDPTDTFILGWLLHVSNDTSAPLVFSISYGTSEASFNKQYGSVSVFHARDPMRSRM